MNKKIIKSLIWVGLCITTLPTFALEPMTPPAGSSGNEDVVAAVNAVTAAIKQVPTQTADKLMPALTDLQNSIKDIQNKQVTTWNQFIQMRADEQFTGPNFDPYVGSDKTGGPDQNQLPPSAYELIDTGAYSPVRQVISTGKLSSFDASGFSMLPQVQASQYGYSDQLALTQALQYNNPEGIKEMVLALIKNTGTPDNPLAIGLPYSALMSIVASRTGSNGSPSEMLSLQQMVENYFSSSWEQGIAVASPLDVARAQLAATALNNYLLYQNMQLQQQQVALLALLAAKNASGK
jgi:hypothetical protein